MDEFLYIHESVGGVIAELFDVSVSGQSLYLAVGAVFAAWWLPLLLRLEQQLRRRVIVAAVLYVGGAAGMEFVGRWYSSLEGQANPVYVGLATLEEMLEMSGIAWLVYALLRHLAMLQSAGRPLGIGTREHAAGDTA